MHSIRLFLVSLALAVSVTALGQTPIPAAPSINAKSYLIRDHNSGKLIAEKNSHQRLAPASITKLMTAYVTFKKLAEGSITLESMVPISKRAYDSEGSRMFVEINSKVRMEDLIKGMIVQSGNDASIAIAEFIGGTEEVFATLMNYHADALGMDNSQFLNSTGLPTEGHYSTAWDIAALTSAIIDEFPEYYRWYSQKKFTYNSIPQSNRNTLLWTDSTVDGVKTGFTEEAGYCLVSSALRGEMRLVAVVLGTPTKKGRANASQSLLNYAYNFYRTHRLYEAGAALATVKVWKADDKNLPVGLQDELYVTIPKGQYDSLQATMNLQEPLSAPITAETPLGSVTVELQGEVVAQIPLVALRDVAEGSWFQRLSDSVMLWFE
ncbi:MAG: D-alanyl-D-alanine carboxypeptidase family protein [Gammaproteobacteria bacterium]